MIQLFENPKTFSAFGNKSPIVSTSANISGQKTPNSFKDISPDIVKNVDYVVNLHRNKKSDKPSAIIKLSNDGKVSVVRK